MPSCESEIDLVLRMLVVLPRGWVGDASEDSTLSNSIVILEISSALRGLMLATDSIASSILLSSSPPSLKLPSDALFLVAAPERWGSSGATTGVAA
eukprot:CAMPEP_0114154890 /NCGR_PEP_ID=MMETSP0043_2-20121206/25163_1 /TAXON_ID=464988 /ORGANISM="Hemiselmis andersenii, Strain CCMP644" /LENGTH=95 /DNA_ID=CAMNT_0001250089 /DNA_START=54 /DNA_END=338 /DNA_ORIENTATION=-